MSVAADVRCLLRCGAAARCPPASLSFRHCAPRLWRCALCGRRQRSAALPAATEPEGGVISERDHRLLTAHALCFWPPAHSVSQSLTLLSLATSASRRRRIPRAAPPLLPPSPRVALVRSLSQFIMGKKASKATKKFQKNNLPRELTKRKHDQKKKAIRGTAAAHSRLMHANQCAANGDNTTMRDRDGARADSLTSPCPAAVLVVRTAQRRAWRST